MPPFPGPRLMSWWTAPTGEDLDLAAVHPDRYGDLEDTCRVRQDPVDVGVEADQGSSVVDPFQYCNPRVVRCGHVFIDLRLRLPAKASPLAHAPWRKGGRCPRMTRWTQRSSAAQVTS